MLMFFQRLYGALLLSSIMVAPQYLCHIRTPEYFLLQPVCSGSSETHGSRRFGEVHRLLEGVKIVQSGLMGVIGFHPVTPLLSTKFYWWKNSICGMAHGGTSCIIHPRETAGAFRHVFHSCAVIQSWTVGPVAALLCLAVVQRSEERTTRVQSIKHDHL